MEMVFARANYAHESRALSTAHAISARSAGYLRERLLVSPIGWISMIGIIAGSLSEYAQLLVRFKNFFDPYSTYLSPDIASVFGASNFIHALIPALGFLDGGLTMLITSLVVRYGVMKLLETKRPVIAGVTGLRRGRVIALAHKMAQVTSMRATGASFRGGVANFNNGRPQIAVSFGRFGPNSTWAHELSHIIDFYVTGSYMGVLSRYMNHPGAQDMYTVYERHYGKTQPHDIPSEAFAEFCAHYMRHPHLTKLLYPKGVALLKKIVNGSPAGKFIQFV